MREIKFRAWGTNKPCFSEQANLVGKGILEEMVYFGLLDLDGTLIVPSMTYLEGDYSLMQYTDLKDKNGKEIYEGDILDFVHLYGVRPAPIFWRNGGFWVAVNDPGYEDRWIVPDPEECEVIGNIYENPELLNPVK